MSSSLPLTYYVQFRNADGSIVTGADGQTWFAADEFGFATSIATTSGQTSSKETFGALDLSIGNDTSLPDLFQNGAAGTGFVQVEVAGYSGTGSSATLVTDDVFKQAAITTDAPDAAGTALALQYDDVVERSYATATDGTVSLANTEGYNLVTNKADTGTETVAGTPGYAPTAPLDGTPTAVPVAAPLTYYVQFRGADGVPLASAGGQTWFAVTAVSSSETLPATSQGAGAPSVTFGALTFTLAGNALQLLLAQEAAGTVFSAVELAGYNGTGTLAPLTADEVFKNAEITSLTTGSDGSQTVELESNDEVQSAYRVEDGGVLSPAYVGGWNVSTQTADDTSGALAPSVPPRATTGVPLTYYVRFHDASGAVIAGDDGDTWFPISDLSFDITETAGKMTLQPLSFDLLPDSVRTALFAQQSAGVSLREVEIAGYSPSGTLEQDDAFNGVLLKSDVLSSDGTAVLTFAPTGLTEQSGAGGSVTTVGSSDIAPTLNAGAAPPAIPPSPRTLEYFVQFRTSTGALLANADGTTWFAVSGVDFGSSQTGGAGKLTFDSLTFTLDNNDTILPTLFEQEAASTPFSMIELAGYSGTGAAAQLVQDDVFKAALINGDTAAAAGTTISVAPVAYVESTYSNGSLAATAGWSLQTNSADDTYDGADGLPGNAPDAPVTGTPQAAAASGPLTYYVQFHDNTGAVITDPSGAGWFAITDLSMPTTKAAGVGNGTTTIDFGPASFTLSDPGISAQLFSDEASGATLGYIEIAGYDGTSGISDLVQDSILKYAGVSSIATTGGGTSVGVEYGGAVERSYLSGSEGPVTAGWDRVGNRADSSTTNIEGEGGASGGPAAVELAPLQGVPTSPAAVSPTFYVSFDDPDTKTPMLDANGDGYFQVSSLDFGFSQTLDIGSTSGGTGAGKVAFNELTVTLAPNSLLPTLFAEQAAGTQTPVELAGYVTEGSTPVRSEDYQFLVAKPISITANSDGSETLVFEYGEVDETLASKASDGSVETDQTFGFDSVKNVPADGGSGYQTAPLDSVPACYCPGTRIAVPGGETPIEELQAGDMVLTADGRSLPVLWIGRRSYASRFVAARRDLLPVTIHAGALADAVPARDLVVSPEHAMLIDGVLVPARHLVNGVTVTRVTQPREVHYLHIELSEHEAILAEGAPAESFVDDDSRGAFQNAHERSGAACGPARYCAPRVSAGYELERIRRRVDARARQAA